MTADYDFSKPGRLNIDQPPRISDEVRQAAHRPARFSELAFYLAISATIALAALSALAWWVVG